MVRFHIHVQKTKVQPMFLTLAKTEHNCFIGGSAITGVSGSACLPNIPPQGWMTMTCLSFFSIRTQGVLWSGSRKVSGLSKILRLPKCWLAKGGTRTQRGGLKRWHRDGHTARKYMYSGFSEVHSLSPYGKWNAANAGWKPPADLAFMFLPFADFSTLRNAKRLKSC